LFKFLLGVEQGFRDGSFGGNDRIGAQSTLRIDMGDFDSTIMQNSGDQQVAMA